LYSSFESETLTRRRSARSCNHILLRGQNVMNQGDDADTVFFLLKGAVSCWTSVVEVTSCQPCYISEERRCLLLSQMMQPLAQA
jgi:hypothetical protein